LTGLTETVKSNVYPFRADIAKANKLIFATCRCKRSKKEGERERKCIQKIEKKIERKTDRRGKEQKTTLEVFVNWYVGGASVSQQRTVHFGCRCEEQGRMSRPSHTLLSNSSTLSA
jgi:hypothetical protein